MPGGAFAYLVENPNISPEYRNVLIRQFGLDKSIPEQYLFFLREFFLRGNLGISFYYRKPVMEVLLSALPWTLLLVTTSVIVSAIIGVFLGLISASKRGFFLDRALLNISIFIESMPPFWLGLLLLIVFAYHLRLFPLYGVYTYGRIYGSFLEYFLDVIHHLTLPFITLVLLNTSGFIILSRSMAIDVLTEDFVMIARAKGLSERKILSKHVLRPVLNPVLTITAINLGYSMGGALIVETVFSLPGIGKLMYDAVFMTDYPVLMGVVVLISSVTLTLITIVEILASIIDPRVKGH
ncbi:MAG: ABC transporter permease [Desulfurococcaceae archaeon]